MKSTEKKPTARSPKPVGRTKSEISGGANLKGKLINVGGDVVGRDKVEVEPGAILVEKGGRYTNVSIPRWVQIAIGVGAIALVAIAIVWIIRPVNVANGNFENGLSDWQISDGGVQVVATGESSASPAGKHAAELPLGASVQQTVTVSTDQPQLTVWYRSPPSNVAHGTLHIYLNDDLQLTVEQVAAEASQWKVAVVPDLSSYAGKQVRLRLEYSAALSRLGGRLSLPAIQNVDVLWITNIKLINQAELATIVVTVTPSPTPTPTLIPSPTPTRLIPRAKLSLQFSVTNTACVDRTYYNIEFSIKAQGGTPPYTFYRDVDKVGGPTSAGILYTLTYGENHAAVGTLAVVDSASQRAEEKFFVPPLNCP